ncbi:MAG: hypothetical protein IPL12_00410 [Bacteroidetes bacterium]|nr:hypothetical protein [Bacteroidota bacterium]
MAKDFGGESGDTFAELIQLESGITLSQLTPIQTNQHKNILNLKDPESDEWGEYDISTRSDFWVLKINSVGEMIGKNYGDFDQESAVSLFQYEDNKITIVAIK